MLEAHRRHVARRFPALAALKMVATFVWLLMLAQGGEVTRTHVAGTLAGQLLVLMPAAAVCRRRPTAPWVLPVAVAAFAVVGLSWIAVFALSGASGIVLGFIVFVLYATVAIGTAWGIVPQLVLQGVVTSSLCRSC